MLRFRVLQFYVTSTITIVLAFHGRLESRETSSCFVLHNHLDYELFYALPALIGLGGDC